jgi:hypothetical protein
MGEPAVLQEHPDRRHGIGIQQTLTDRGFANRKLNPRIFFIYIHLRDRLILFYVFMGYEHG